MVLDMNLFRDILLYLESAEYYVENDDGGIVNKSITLTDIADEFPSRSKAELFYTVQNISGAGYISLSAPHPGNAIYNCYVHCLTFEGHEFIAAVRSQEKWNGILKALPIIKDHSLAAIQALSKGATAAAIEAYITAAV